MKKAFVPSVVIIDSNPIRFVEHKANAVGTKKVQVPVYRGMPAKMVSYLRSQVKRNNAVA